MRKKKHTYFEDEHGNRYEAIIETNPTKIYLNSLILNMFRAGTVSCMLIESEPMPQIPDYDKEMPTFEHLMNRLKVLCQLDPVRYPLPKQGKVELMLSNHIYFLHASFDDCAADRSVEIRLEKAD